MAVMTCVIMKMVSVVCLALFRYLSVALAARASSAPDCCVTQATLAAAPCLHNMSVLGCIAVATELSEIITGNIEKDRAPDAKIV